MAMPSLQAVTADVRQAPSFRVLGVRVDAVQIADVVRRMEDWIAQRGSCQYIAVTGMHGVTEAQHDAQFKAVLNSAGLVVADGMPLVWIGRWLGFNLRRRVYGPELMATFCEQTAAKGYRHFFYGGAPGVAEELASRMVARFPGVIAAGTYSPPRSHPGSGQPFGTRVPLPHQARHRKKSGDSLSPQFARRKWPSIRVHRRGAAG